MNAYQVPADPTAVVGRRIGAFVINFVILIAALFIGSLLADFKSEDIPDGFSDSLGGRSVCDVIEQDSNISVCFESNGTVYYSDSGGAVAKLLLPFTVVFLLNHVLLAGATGASVGKHATGLRVVKKGTGQIAGFGAAVLRSLLWVVDYFPYCFPIVGLVTGLATKGHRRVGDMAVGTLVVAKSSVGVVPVVPGLNAPAMGAYAPAAAGAYPPPAPTWGTPPPPSSDPWNSPPPTAAAPGTWAPPPAQDAWAPPAAAAAGAAAASSWDAPAPEQTSAYPVAPAPETWDSPAEPAPPAWEPRAEATVMSTPDPEPAPPTWEPVAEPPAPAPAWEPRTVLAPQPEPDLATEPEPEPEPEAVVEPEPEPAPAAAAAEETPGVGAPMWDAARNAYIQWDPAVGSWMQWDDSAGQWRPIS